MKKVFIHKFKLNSKYIVIDVPSGSVHVVDEIIFDIIDEAYKFNCIEIVDKFKSKYNENDIKIAYDEIKDLESEGLIYTEEVQVDVTKYHKHVIKAMCLHVAHDCNLKCEYCFAAQGNFHGERHLMSLETGKKALDFLISHSGNRRNLEVDFFGGEPLMNFDVVKQLVAYGRRVEKEHNKHFRFTLTTNGMLLNDDTIDYINENMDNVVLSLDGRREVNDLMRKTLNDKGSYDIIVPKFKKLISKRGKKDYYIRGTFTSNNLDFADDVVNYYEEGFKKVSMEPVVTDLNEPYALRESDLSRILEEYERLSKIYLDIKKKDDDFLFFHFMIDLSQGPCIVKRLSGCGAGVEYVAVTPEGDIYPCHQFVGNSEFKLGTLETGIVKTEITDNFKCANVMEKRACAECWAKYYCSGGCHANAYYQSGDLKKPYSMGCEMEKKRIECAISVLANK